ncbi:MULTISPECIES: DUF5079 family protein [Staphylococcus]|uniref:DUF5079 domain-containing protein n=1 Tax=Staphylococcus agnetis TaxID=985762 RepID=A0A2T4MHJ0_9STAP|nr:MULTISPECIES: DUF5079 family protein [Staphylococcus]ALN77770.1 DUF5079 family protein [Staphylococcus agnetis]NHM92705.1 DUF5079 family protein [Staphylococcus sp. 10602379]NJI01432.1 DUF5079 family protein [Staphylococcus agnetis]NJI13115.1 DUF5079 family protein [Staphylococcus agnetis]OSP20280.1 DUF5079 domain-containing protein [Staphylococcus agnetis]
MLETYITKLKKSYLKPYVIFLMLLLGVFYTIAMVFTQAWSEVSITIYVTLVVWLISCLVIMKQDSFNNIKVNKLSAFRYLIVNLFVGYMQLIATSVGYILGNAYTHWDLLDYWLWVQFAIFISFLGLLLFCINEFHIMVKKAKISLNILAVLLKLFSIGLIIYISLTAPSIGDEKVYFWLVIVNLIPIDAFLIRSFFFYALVVGTLNGDFEQPGNASISEE